MSVLIQMMKWKQWKNKTNSKGKGKGKAQAKGGGGKYAKTIASAVETQVAAKLKEIEEEKLTEEQGKAYIMGLLKEISSAESDSKPSAKKAATSSAVVLKSILKKAKNID